MRSRGLAVQIPGQKLARFGTAFKEPLEQKSLVRRQAGRKPRRPERKETHAVQQPVYLPGRRI